VQLLGLTSIALAVAAFYAFAATEIDSAAFYAALGFVCAFIGYCAGSIEDLRRRIRRVEREAVLLQADAGPDEAREAGRLGD
jgi:hypothetical protein